jgi:phage terminase Nu1 subunit (DNA packaging protein)
MINKPPEFLRAYQVAELFNVHMSTVKRIPEKDLPYWKFGSRGDRMYAHKDVEEYINKRYVR